MPTLQIDTIAYDDEAQHDALVSAAIKAPHSLGGDPQFGMLQSAMRSMVPVPGGDDWTKDVAVVIQPHGPPVVTHRHPEWTVIYYVDPGTPPVAVIVDGVRIEPKRGMMLAMAPNTPHHVERSKSTTRRISFAMLVPDPTSPPT